jgi:hypothetical protein
MKRPLLVSDCDEVLLHMIVPFRDWLDEAHHIHFDMVHGDWGEALRHKYDGTQVATGRVWELLNAFFETEMHRQPPITGSVDAIAELSQIADIAILTNLLDHHQVARGNQLRAIGIDAPVYCNQGGKGRALAKIIAEHDPSVVVFVDDLSHQHQSVAKHLPEVWRLQMVGEPLLAGRVAPEPMAHQRIDDWDEAKVWIRDKLRAASPAPMLEEIST